MVDVWWVHSGRMVGGILEARLCYSRFSHFVFDRISISDGLDGMPFLSKYYIKCSNFLSLCLRILLLLRRLLLPPIR